MNSATGLTWDFEHPNPPVPFTQRLLDAYAGQDCRVVCIATKIFPETGIEN